jgi:hypothetical protein
MNMVVERTRTKYRNAREQACYSIMDIEFILKTMAIDGIVWCLNEMPDLSEGEKILINFYQNEFREYQIFDFYSPSKDPLS